MIHSHAYAFLNDRKAYTWGDNSDGQLGTGNQTNYSSPVLLIGNHTFSRISTGLNHTVALKDNGEAWGWGNNSSGKLGNNTTTSYSSPIPVVGNHSFISIFAGGDHTVALKADGSAWTWGQNNVGQLGTNSITIRSSPVKVVGTFSFSAVFASSYNSYFLSNFKLWSAGHGYRGQIGDGGFSHRSSPCSVVTTASFIHVATGFHTIAALDINSNFFWWGANPWFDANCATPRLFLANSSFYQLAVAPVFMAGLRTDGKLFTTGYNKNWPPDASWDGSLGYYDYYSLSFKEVLGNHSFVSIAAGNEWPYSSSQPRRHVYALKNNGEVWTWGSGLYGFLGDNTTIFRSSPHLVVGGFAFTSLSDYRGSFVTVSDSTILYSFTSGADALRTPLFNFDSSINYSFSVKHDKYFKVNPISIFDYYNLTSGIIKKDS